MRRTAMGALAAVALAGAAVPPATADEPAALLGAGGVEAVARRAAKAWGDARPRSIEYASGTYAAADAVIDPGAGGSAQSGTAGPVDLVLMRGRFTANAPGPRGAAPVRGRFLELIVDARSGAVEVRSLRRDRPTVPLSRLGRVRVLHGAGGGPRRR